MDRQTLPLCCVGPDYTDLIAASRAWRRYAFCLVGGRARVGGIGEDVQPLPPNDLGVTLIIPPLACSTPEVYRAWDQLGGPRARGTERSGTGGIASATRTCSWRDRIAQAAGQQPTLAGSGATWFVHGHHSRW